MSQVKRIYILMIWESKEFYEIVYKSLEEFEETL